MFMMIYICPDCGRIEHPSFEDPFFINGRFCKDCGHFIDKDRWTRHKNMYLVNKIKVLVKGKNWWNFNKKVDCYEMEKSYSKEALVNLKVIPKSIKLILSDGN